MSGPWCHGTIPFWQLYSPRFTSSCHRLHELCLIICALAQFRDVLFPETDANTLPESRTLILFPYHMFAFDTTESAKVIRQQNYILDFRCKTCFYNFSVIYHSLNDSSVTAVAVSCILMFNTFVLSAVGFVVLPFSLPRCCAGSSACGHFS